MARQKRRQKNGRNSTKHAEVRLWTPQRVEVRADSKDPNVINLRGLVIRWAPTSYPVTDSVGTFTERIHRGAVTRFLADPKAEAKFYYGHGGLPLASRSKGTLTLTDTDEGLAVHASLSALQQLANDLAISIERGDVEQMSVGMIVQRDEWNADYTTRDIFDIDVLDASAVDFGASPTTHIEVARSRYGSTFIPSYQSRGGSRGGVSNGMGDEPDIHTYEELIRDQAKMAKRHAKQNAVIRQLLESGDEYARLSPERKKVLDRARSMVADYEAKKKAESERLRRVYAQVRGLPS